MTREITVNAVTVTDIGIVALVAQGKTVAASGRAYGLGEIATQRRLQRLRHRWNARNITHLVALFYENSLLPLLECCATSVRTYEHRCEGSCASNVNLSAVTLDENKKRYKNGYRALRTER